MTWLPYLPLLESLILTILSLISVSSFFIPFLKNNTATKADIGTAATIPIEPIRNLTISNEISN